MGNIGFPVCSFIPVLKAEILPLWRFLTSIMQLIEFKTSISVLTNISEAHLDFHGSYEAYKNMKRRIFNHHTQQDIAVLNYDDKESLELAKDIRSVKKYFSSGQINDTGCSITDGSIFYYSHYKAEKIIDLEDIKLRGSHNYENIMAAITAVKEFNVDNDSIIRVLKTFGGVEHRQEYNHKWY